MESVTKTKLSMEKIIRMVKKAFGNHAELKAAKELTDGLFNTAYSIHLKDGQSFVLKVSPTTNIQVMRYEKNIMETEVFALDRISLIREVPVPKVLFYDKSRDIIDGEYFFMEFINGIPLNKVRQMLSDEKHQAVSKELGKIAKKVSGIKGEYFGSIAEENKRFSKWSDAFLSMINDLMEDAQEAGVSLPYESHKVLSMIYACKDVLNDVKEPSLIHKDLWEGNVFINPETAEITGIIDFERAIFADELLEVVCGFLLENESFLNIYRGNVLLNESEKIRCTLYKVYLFLIMIIECTYRKFEGESHEAWARERLVEALEELSYWIKSNSY